MSLKKSVLLSISGLCLGIVSVIIISFFTETNNSAHAVTGQLKVVSERLIERGIKSKVPQEKLANVPFHAKEKMPTFLPFKANKTFDEVLPFMDESVESVSHFYNTEEKSYVSISVTDEDVVPSDEGIIDIQTNKGKAQYFDNGVFQYIFLNDGGLFYTIKAQKNYEDPDVKFSKDELVSIADGLKSQHK